VVIFADLAKRSQERALGAANSVKEGIGLRMTEAMEIETACGAEVIRRVGE
jgi:hypothetical protein